MRVTPREAGSSSRKQLAHRNVCVSDSSNVIPLTMAAAIPTYLTHPQIKKKF